MYWIFSCNIQRRHPYIHKTFEFYVLNHNYYQKIDQVISKTVMRKRSLWVFTSFGGIIYYESKSMFVIYSLGLLQNYYIFSLKVLSCSIVRKLSLHLLFRTKNFANNISPDNFFYWLQKSSQTRCICITKGKCCIISWRPISLAVVFHNHIIFVFSVTKKIIQAI